MKYVLWLFAVFLVVWAWSLVVPERMFEPVATESQIQAVEADLERLERDVMCLKQAFNNYGMQLTHCQPLESGGK